MTDISNNSLSAVEEAIPRSQSTSTSSTGLTSREAIDLLRIHGKNELEDKKTPKWLLLLQQFWAPMPIMIWIAAIVEVAIENYPDFGILLAIQFINAGLGFYEIVKVIRKLLFRNRCKMSLDVVYFNFKLSISLGWRCCCSAKKLIEAIGNSKT